ncbi:hypothetical protein [Paraurantiacibacter namhicola]|uniref:hypothetical protein n=1 Tax=Paraurantiacibacter namhicola TaxID=645517 RepID=UPI0012ED1389|nr:hypothetical protein [Paraurantiacibacter namhicola]
MAPAFLIDVVTGRLTIGEVTLEPHQSKTAAKRCVAPVLTGEKDHANGYEWLYLAGLTFGGRPAALQLCFKQSKLWQASWSVDLPGAPLEVGWPSREAIDNEIASVRAVLEQSGFKFDGRSARYEWGLVWSGYDPKGHLASNGLRYRTA